MPDQQWENLKDMFHAALALVPDERAAYLDRASNGDISLRRAVESLLNSHEQTGNFVDVPAYQAAAEMLVDGANLEPARWRPITELFHCWAKEAWEKYTWPKIPGCTGKCR